MTSDRDREISPPPSDPDAADPRPFPDSLCHRCAAPPQYIRTQRSTFIRCPILKLYPPQPVIACEAFESLEDAKKSDGS
ncbi:MAG: hypothetical protein ABI968_11790 [Acidobacteriota bacterium]